MSSSESQVALTVNASDRATEIFIVDGAYRLAARGLGMLKAQLAEGLYKVKLQCGTHIHEQFIRLERGHETLLGDGSNAKLEAKPTGVTLTFHPLRFASPVPLAETGRTHDYQLSAAEEQSRKVHVSVGQGSEIFLFGRWWTPGSNGGASAPAKSRDASIQLSLHDLEDKQLADLDEQGVRDTSAADPWLACNVSLAPGRYRLRLVAPEYGTLEAMVVASPGWQTQVFLYRRTDQGESLASRLNLAAASVLLRRQGAGFDPRSPDLRLTEQARACLRSRRSLISHQLVDEMLTQKRDNPMLGIYACHLWLLSDKPDLGAVRGVVQGLRGLLGPHPDVEALAIAAGLPASETFPYPPMLQRSWPVLVHETLKRPDLIPRGSLSARVADRLWGEGPLLVWHQDGEAPLTASVKPSLFKSAGVPGLAMAESAPDPRPLDAVLRELSQVDPNQLEAQTKSERLEGALAEVLLASKRAGEKVASGKASRRRLMPITPDALVKTLGVPMASLDDAARALEGKVRGPSH